MIRSIAVVVLLAGGARAQAPTPAVAPTVAGQPAPACLADGLPRLSGVAARRTCNGTAGIDACYAGDGQACWEHAAEMVDDEATRPDAEPYFRRACKLGHGNACTNVAARRWVEHDTDEQDEGARRFFELSCPTDDHFACGMDGALRGFPCRILALNLERGVSTGGDRERIRSLMSEACAGGDTPACGDHATVDETFE